MREVIIGCIISSIISVMLSDVILTGFTKVLIKLGLSKKADVSGIWKATFVVGKGTKKVEYIEVVKLRPRLGMILGYIYPHEENYSELQNYMNKKPLRVKGSITDNRFFTGYWYHPIEHYRFHGSFQLLLNGNLKKMDGQWIGYSESGKLIDSGKWLWEKIK